MISHGNNSIWLSRMGESHMYKLRREVHMGKSSQFVDTKKPFEIDGGISLSQKTETD